MKITKEPVARGDGIVPEIMGATCKIFVAAVAKLKIDEIEVCEMCIKDRGILCLQIIFKKK